MAKFTKAERAAAAAERAAIRNAAPLYVAPEAKTEAEAAAEAAKLAATDRATDARGMLAGQAVAETPEAKAKAAEAAKARAGMPASQRLPEAKPARLAWHIINGREYAAAEARDFWAEQRRLDRAARQAARAEAEAARLAGYGARAVLNTATEAELLALATEHGARAVAEDYLALRTVAAELDVSPDALLAEAESERAAAEDGGRLETFGSAPEAGAVSTMAPERYAAFRDYTRRMLTSPGAAAGRAALDAMGMTCQAVVTVKHGSAKMTVSELHAVPSVAVAEARAAKAKAASKRAKARAKAAAKAAKVAERSAVRARVNTAATKAAKAEAAAAKAKHRARAAREILAAAEAAEAIPGSVGGWVAVPVATLPLNSPAKAAELGIRHSVGRMPARYAYRGPEAKAARAKTDNTATEAIANVMGQTVEAEAEAARRLVESIRAKVAELTAAAEAAREQQRTDYKARRAMAARIRRRAAKGRNN